jgi:signal transduction histidine kinase
MDTPNLSTRRLLKLIHLASMIWFMLCVGYIVVRALHQAGFNWWLIFSLSGHSVLVIFLLVSLYLFALFRGAGGMQHIALEHPLTSTHYYMGLYVAAPLLGGLAGILGMLGVNDLGRFLIGVALGTMGTIFVVWVVIDPMAGLIEMLLPTSRKHRAERLARVEAERRARHERRERVLAEAFAREAQERQRWQRRLQADAERLATLLTDEAPDFYKAEQEALDIGAKAWQLGGLMCMRQLRDMAMDICKSRSDPARAVDYVSYWWDGIGDWRRPSLG